MIDENKKARIAHVKQRIADLVVDQKRDKAKCREPHVVTRNYWGYAISTSAPLDKVLCRSYDISALLNVLHMVRGSDYRHTSQDKWKRHQIESRTKEVYRDVMEKYPVIVAEAISA